MRVTTIKLFTEEVLQVCSAHLRTILQVGIPCKLLYGSAYDDSCDVCTCRFTGLSIDAEAEKFLRGEVLP